jgi:2-amino-4-hydroxy-6-hydroxymethyldihydropteridine diphosphokinase
MNRTYLLIGGNVGNRIKNLREARKQITVKCGVIIKQSAIYETAAWGKTDQAAFLNQVLLVETEFSAQEVLHRILKAELDMGRMRNEKFGPRTIDIDILFFNDDIIHEEGLTIPHPQLHLRKFALEPLNEIAPDLKHPSLGKTVHEMLRDCGDLLPVKKL